MHPTLAKKDALAYVAGRQDGVLGSNDLHATYAGQKGEDWVEPIDLALADVLSEWAKADLKGHSSDQSRDELEGVLSAVLHEGLRGLPAAVLTDKDFWRYCSAYLYDFVIWRQPSKTVSALHPYFGIASESLGVECVPHRMFDRAHIARSGGSVPGEKDPYALAKFGAADVWKSHIIRTRNSFAPVVVHELLLDVRDGKLPTDKVRPLAKNLKRVRSNVLFEVLDGPQARLLLDRESARVSTLPSVALDEDSGAS